MTAPTVRADYDQLGQVANRFGQQAQLVRRTVHELRQQQEVLRGGDWVGEGAQAFYAEMDTQVAPALSRLIGALESANQTTRLIGQVMKAAEDEAARILRVDGAPAAGGGPGTVLTSGPGVDHATATLAAGPGSSAFIGAPGPLPPPPTTTATTKGTVEDIVGIVGGAGSVVSILESGAGAGVGTTIGGYVLPVSSFLLGLKWGLEEEENEKRAAEFMRQMRVSALRSVVDKMNAWNARSESGVAWPFDKVIDEDAESEIHAFDQYWKQDMNAELGQLLLRHRVAQMWDSIPEPTLEEWQAIHDKYANMAFDFMYETYAKRGVAKPQ
jgi:WXG100 family type VII secretion target